MIQPADVLSPAELCERLKVTKFWVYNKMRHPGKNPIPHMRMGKFIRFDWAEVSKWLESQKKGA